MNLEIKKICRVEDLGLYEKKSMQESGVSLSEPWLVFAMKDNDGVVINASNEGIGEIVGEKL